MKVNAREFALIHNNILTESHELGDVLNYVRIEMCAKGGIYMIATDGQVLVTHHSYDYPSMPFSPICVRIDKPIPEKAFIIDFDMGAKKAVILDKSKSPLKTMSATFQESGWFPKWQNAARSGVPSERLDSFHCPVESFAKIFKCIEHEDSQLSIVNLEKVVHVSAGQWKASAYKHKMLTHGSCKALEWHTF